ncbi:putative LTR transposable element, partial [Pseudoloma neurophilia]
LIKDASKDTISAILAQKEINGSLKMIFAFSKKMDKTQLNYSVTDKELLAVIKGNEKYRPYLFGKKLIYIQITRQLNFLGRK